MLSSVGRFSDAQSNFAQPITGISLPTGRDKLYSSSNDGSLRIWDCNSGKCASSIIIGSKVGCLASEGAWLYGGLENEVKAWNFENEREYSLKGVVGSVCSMAVDDDVLYAGLEVIHSFIHLTFTVKLKYV